MLETSAVNIGAWMGRQQAFSLMRGCCTLAQAQSLKEVRESRLYEQLGISWADFCFRRIAGGVTSEAIEIDGEKVALTAENAPRIRAAIQKLRAQQPKPALSAAAPSPEAAWQARFDEFIGELARKSRETPEQRNAIRHMAGKAIHSISLLVKYMESADEREPAA